MATLQLDEKQLNNLEVFLSRTNMNATEVGAFQELIKIIYTAKEEAKKSDGKVESRNK